MEAPPSPLSSRPKRSEVEGSAVPQTPPGDVFRQSLGPAVPPTLKHIPKVLVIDVVVVLHLRRFHKRAQQPWAPIRGRLLQIRVSLFDVASQQRIGPLRSMEVLQCGVDVIRQEPLRLANILDLRRLPVEA